MLMVPTTLIESHVCVLAVKAEPLTHHVIRHGCHSTDLSRQGSAEAVAVQRLGAEGEGKEEGSGILQAHAWVVVDRITVEREKERR